MRVNQIPSKTIQLLNTPLSGVIPGADAGIMILTTILSLTAFTGAMALLISQIADNFVPVLTAMPSFEMQIVNGAEIGNSSFLIFSILREFSWVFFFFVFVGVGFLIILKQTHLITNDVIKKMLVSAVFGMILLMVFPYVWDPISDGVEYFSIALLNPAYSFDNDSPCNVSSDPRSIQLMELNKEIGEHSVILGLDMPLDDLCKPELRINYLFAKAMFGADMAYAFEEEEDDGWDWNILDQITAQLSVFSESVFSVIFTGMTKTSMIFFLATMAAMVGDMRYLLIDVIAMGLPLILVFRCFPFFYIDKISTTLSSLFVPLLLTPIFGSLIILAGTANLVALESDAVLISSAEELDNIVQGRYLFWIHAVATLSLAVMAPVIFSPILGSVSGMMSNMVMTGTISGIMGAASTVKGIGQGGASAISGLAAGGGIGLMGAAKQVFTNPAARRTFAQGLGTGFKSGAGDAFRSDLAGANRITPGAGSSVLRNMGGSTFDGIRNDARIVGAEEFGGTSSDSENDSQTRITDFNNKGDGDMSQRKGKEEK